jgi:hypothetical protein
MDNKDFKISTNLVWFLVIGNTLLTIIGAFAKIYDWNYAEYIITIGLMTYFTTWVIILNDMVKQKIYNKTFWVISMIITPSISSIFYMFQRKRLIRLGAKLN